MMETVFRAWTQPREWERQTGSDCYCRSFRYLQCDSCGMVRREQGWYSPGAQCDHHDTFGCPGRMHLCGGGDFTFTALQPWEQCMQTKCNCIAPAVNLRLCSIAGEAREVGVRDDWTMAQVKLKMQQVHDIPADQVCLSFRGAILQDRSLVSQLQLKDSQTVSWVRRHPEVALWLKLVQQDWQNIRTAPEVARKSAEVMFEVMRQSHEGIQHMDTELFRDAHFLGQACEMRGFPGADVLPQRWLQDVVDVLLLLAFAAATKDEGLSQVALTCAALAKASAWDSVSLVVTMVSQVDLAEAIRSSLLDRLQAGLPPEALAEGFNDWALADLHLALLLLEAQKAAGENPARFRARQDGQRLLQNMPENRWRHHEFAVKVFVEHEDRLSTAEFERLLRHMVFNMLMPQEVFRLVLACLAHAQPAAARELFVFAANADETEAIRLMLETELPLTAMDGNMSDFARAKIFHAVMSDWARGQNGSRDMTALLSCIEEDRRHIQQLLAWARANKCVAIAANHHLEDALFLALASRVEVGSQLMCTLAECGVLPAGIAQELPLEWLGQLRQVPEGRQVVVQGLLAQLEPCEDEQLVQRMRHFWQFEVWSEVDGSTCERAVRLLSRFCQAEQGPSVVFACKVLRGLPLNELPGAELLYEPSLPAQAIGIRAEQLAHVLANEAKQAAKGALEKAQEALREAHRALHQAEQAHRGADATRDLARQAVQTALHGEQLALQALEATSSIMRRY